PLPRCPPAPAWLLARGDRGTARPPPPAVELHLRQSRPRRPAFGGARGHRGAAVMSALAVSEEAQLSASFISSLAPHLEAYLKLMRAVGRRYERVEQILRQLDRFVAKEPQADIVLTR